MSSQPFALKNARASPTSAPRQSWGEPSSFRYDSDGDSFSDTDSYENSYRHSDPLSPRSDSPASISSAGTSNMPPSPLTFGFDPESFQFYQTVKPSAVMLEESIDSLPHGSQMKNTLIHIRHQMKKSLLRLKELEDQVRNIPTLQVRISVLQEEKRQLLRQLQANGGRKKRSGYGQDLYLNSLRQRGCKSDTEEDNDEFSSIRRKLRQRLHSAGDQPNEENVCDRCKGSIAAILPKMRIPRSRGTQTKIEGVNNLIWDGKWSRNGADINGNVPLSRRVETRSVGVGMMRSFTKECGVGDSVAVQKVEDSGIQSSVAMVEQACDAIDVSRDDVGVTVKPLLKSKATSTLDIAQDNGKPETLNAQTQTGFSEPFVSVGVGICAVDDEFCTRCATVEASLSTKTVDEIIATHIDLPVPRSIGTGDASLTDSYLCDRCTNLEIRDSGSGDLGVDDPYMCQRCTDVKTSDSGCGDTSITDNYYCYRCYNLSTRSVGSGEFDVTNTVCDKCTNDPKRSLKRTHSVGVGSCRVTDVLLIANECRSLGVGEHAVSDLFCDRCTNIKTKSAGSNTVTMGTRTIGVSDSCLSDSYCDRCMNVRTRSLGVGECCLTDNFCERCFHLQTKTIGTGDYDINDSGYDLRATADRICERCSSRQTKTIGTGDYDVSDCANEPRTTADCYIRGPKVIHINGDAEKAEISCYVTKKYSTSDDFTDSSERSETTASTLTGISDTLESDNDSIDHDNPSSDSTGQMSEPTDASSGFHQTRIRINEEVVLACKLLNGHLYKDKEIGREQMVSCMGTVESNWFDSVSTTKCRSDVIRSYIKTFRTHIPVLLETIVNLSDAEGNNALHYAVTYRNWKVVNVLLNTGCVDVNLVNKAGYSSVMLAAVTGCQKDQYRNVARRLFQMGDVNKRYGETGQTPLMLAVSRGRLDMVDLLLETDADVNAQDNEGSSAMSIAMERNFKDIAVLIYAHSNFPPPSPGRKRTSVV
ncbi:KN motif and ankyrin repeat domain-containing protein 1 isoform X2 [Nematostella vectensis]|uniref:KN motif and ankyrin repeat domain-containing protein 1 isoform X2 n=1 Tax=Nematostella vectensis TaxID=45351 RepID=UPI002076E5C3|nr:KN motif and ankyrin repeat domain-containing protein 1 isoform X2 [Nematostella vectensis]